MSPIFRSTSVAMRDWDQRSVFRWALPGSVVLHLLVAALLIFGLPVSLSQPQAEQAIAVDLVPPPPEKAEVEPPPPAAETKPGKSQANVEMPPSGSGDSARPLPALSPVFQFGERETGPRESPDGNKAEDGSPTTPSDRDKEDLAGPPAAATDEAISRAPGPGAPPTAAPKPTDTAKVQKSPKLQEAQTLFSRTATGNPVATTAMGNVPRGVRAGRLCVTELREQLRHASPPFFPDLLPSERLSDGTTIEIPNAAFRTNGQWYDLSYRCEVDGDATRVVSFAFRVGSPVPRSEWQRRGLPSQ